MEYPKVEIDLNKLRHNVRVLVDLCKKYNIDVAGVTKVLCGNPEIAKAYVDGGVKYIADSRIENLIKLKEINLPKMLIRIPMISEVDKIVEYA
ncbi:MAG: alanine/ornithine racemase family PLP-dependent enzyme, partial [Tissierellales bacterium]